MVRIDEVVLHRLYSESEGWQKQKLLKIFWIVQKSYNKSPTWSLSKSADKLYMYSS